MTVNIPKEFRIYFEGSTDKIDNLYKILLSIDLYLKEIISLNKAAELSGLSFDEFLNELRLRKIKRLSGYDTIADFEEENIVLKRFVKE